LVLSLFWSTQTKPAKITSPASVISLCVDQKSEHNCSNVTLLPSPESASRARVFAKDRRVDFAGGSGGPIEAGHALGDLRGRGWRRPAGAEASRCRNTLV
jgi:hypothetical protein